MTCWASGALLKKNMITKNKFILDDNTEAIGKLVVDAAYRVHKELGPGLLEKIYECCLQHELKKSGCDVIRQLNVPIIYDGIVFEEGLRIDLLVNDVIIVEAKAVETVNPVWESQIISQLKLTGKSLGYLINFNVPLIKYGIRRYINTKE